MGKEPVLVILVLLLLAAIVAIIIVCFRTTYGLRPLEEEEPLWKTSVVHQVHARSLYDAHPDGEGDITGITSKVDYLKELGVGIVCISPIYTSPMKDFGFDISNFTDIDPSFSNMTEFEHLITAFHKRDMKVVLDIVPNHSSDQHEWFVRSVAGQAPYTDYYTWAHAKGVDAHGNPIPPNNWLSVYHGSAWQWNKQRRQFYLHQFKAEEPDLNYRNPLVREEMKQVLVFWLNKDVDGFKIEALKHLFEAEDLSQDEPKATHSGISDPRDYNSLNHTLTTNHPETLVVLREWRLVLDQYPDKVLMVGVSGDRVDTVMKYYGNSTDPLADIPFNPLLINSLMDRSHVTGKTLRSTIALWLDNLPKGKWPNWLDNLPKGKWPNWLDNLPKGKWPNWLLGTQDGTQVAWRVGTDLVDALSMMALLLPGTPITYNGQEIGLSTANTTGLPVSPSYKTLTGESQASVSHLKIFKELTVLRREQVFRIGRLEFPVVTKHTFSFIRSLEGAKTYMLVINTSEEDSLVDLHLNSTLVLPHTGTVVLRSSADTSVATLPGTEVALDKVPLVAGEGILLKLSLHLP